MIRGQGGQVYRVPMSMLRQIMNDDNEDEDEAEEEEKKDGDEDN